MISRGQALMSWCWLGLWERGGVCRTPPPCLVIRVGPHLFPQNTWAGQSHGRGRERQGLILTCPPFLGGEIPEEG